MHQIDTTNAAAAMPVPAAAATAGWFQDTNPLAITSLSADWGNAVQGELKYAIEAFGVTLDKTKVNQLGDALTEYVLTNGRFSTSLYAVYESGIVNDYHFYVQKLIPSPGVYDADTWSDFFSSRKGYWVGPEATSQKVIDENADATLQSVTAAKGLTTVAPSMASASWNNTDSRFDITLNEVGGYIQIPFDGTHKLDADRGNVIELRVTDSKVNFATGSRVHVQIENDATTAAFTVANVSGPACGYFKVLLMNLGTADIVRNAWIRFDIINPA